MDTEAPPPSSRPPSGAVIATITHAAKLLAKKPGFAVRVFHLIFIPFSLIVLLHSFLVSPLLERVEDAYEVSSVDPDDVWALAARESIFFLSFSAVSFLGMMLVVLGTDLVCSGVDERINVRGLLIRVRTTWKVPLLVWLLVSALTVACVIATVLTFLLVNDVNIWWSCFVIVSAAVSYLWFSAIGNLTLVVSVLEDGIGDLKIVATRSWKLMRGRWRDGFGIMLALEAMSVPIYVVFSVTTTDDDDVLGLLTRFGFGYAATLLFCIARFFSFVVFTVFYHECRKSNGEELGTELRHGCCYSYYYNAVPKDDVADLESSVP